jgi:hypothetical protein
MEGESDKSNDYQNYRTSGFWKWVYSRQPEAIKDTLWAVWADTHVNAIMGGQVLWILENTNEVHYQDTFLSVWPEPTFDFLRFAMDACYFKDFDVNETKADELWASYPYLGSPKVVYAKGGSITTLQSGKPGSSKDDPVEIKNYCLQYALNLHGFASPPQGIVKKGEVRSIILNMTL